MSRYGGFRIGKFRILDQWDERKAPSSNQITAPETIQEFDYTIAQGIWNLRSTTQFPKKETPIGAISWSFVASSNSVDSSNITIPSSAQTGDVAVLFDSTATVSLRIPYGWTSVISLDNTFETSVSYKILESSDPGSLITGQSDPTYSVKIMLVFRPSFAVSTVAISSLVNSGETASIPAPQIVSASTNPPQTIVFGMVRAYQSQPFINENTWPYTFYRSEPSGNHMKVFYEIQTANITRTVSLSADYGLYNFAMGFALNAN